MRITAPDYYNEFSCIAGACRHSCCIGWEIDIDGETLAFYDGIGGELGQRLQKNICREGGAHFCLDEKERCPFLNGQGLCDIIIEQGEEALCQICDDHPRFRNFFSDREEIGLGLCCEAAALLIVSRKEKTGMIVLEEGEETLFPEEEAFLALRERVFTCLQDRSRPVFARLERMLVLCGAEPLEFDAAVWAKELLSLERLSEERDIVLQKVLEMPDAVLPGEGWVETALEQLAVYFVFRHLADSLEDDRLTARAAFVDLSVRMIGAMAAAVYGEGLTCSDLAETARLYSSEVEYSPENLEILLEKLS